MSTNYFAGTGKQFQKQAASFKTDSPNTKAYKLTSLPSSSQNQEKLLFFQLPAP
jgi:hypothetical protein